MGRKAVISAAKGSKHTQKVLEKEKALQKGLKAPIELLRLFWKETSASIIVHNRLSMRESELWYYFLIAVDRTRISSANNLFEFVQTHNFSYPKKFVSTNHRDFLKTFKSLREKGLIVEHDEKWSARSQKKMLLTWAIPQTITKQLKQLGLFSTIPDQDRVKWLRKGLEQALYK
ncbi:MAG: hypothetical protein QGF25_06910 [Candidatus Woesearchaeota archaeon]|nr:hypothetical protein [Candidatus Woesearchaeota archaeon]